MLNRIRQSLFLRDAVIFLAVQILIAWLFPANQTLPWSAPLGTLICLALICSARWAAKVYKHIWRYARAEEYISLMLADAVAWAASLALSCAAPLGMTAEGISLLFAVHLLVSLALRFVYQVIYQKRQSVSPLEQWALKITVALTGNVFPAAPALDANRIKVAIIGAGSVGTMLKEELLHNPKSLYLPVCFVDADRTKAGRMIGSIPVIGSENKVEKKLEQLSVQTVIFAMGSVTEKRRAELYAEYKAMGYKIMVYDYPLHATEEQGRRILHDINIEDLLFRTSSQFLDEKTMAWYAGKTVLITGGGGSIGAELARQIAQCGPRQLILMDVYENGVYDVQQELIRRWGDAMKLRVEIASICDRGALERMFDKYRPDIVLHAAAHKHVPLMEDNVCEAVNNNVFGTLNVVEVSEKYGVGRFIMISTDKAVNPTNVMGATKRLCEMIIQSREAPHTAFCATRFGNVLGSNGSVIPLFRRQIQGGGPVTVTDKRVIRYFMTIPEAAQLVMVSGAMANRGELYVLDMGKPIRILDLAENMIRMSGLEPYKDIDIVEIGLRPGEKLYEELLIKTETLDKTENGKIYVERSTPSSQKEMNEKLEALRRISDAGDDGAARRMLQQLVPTFHTPEEVNRAAAEAEEMRQAEGAR